MGATEVWRDGLRVDLGTRKRRALLAALALSAGRPVATDTLIELLWGDAPPDGVAGTLQAYVSVLRRALEPDRAPRAPATVLVTLDNGYGLQVDADVVDATCFERAVTDAHRRLGDRESPWEPPRMDRSALRETAAALDDALALWRGDPYADLGDNGAAVPERARLEELRSMALEDRAYAALSLGNHATVAAELEALTAAYPLRERLWGLRAVALARAGRQADALAVLRELHDVLDTELGLEPSSELRDLQTALLRQEPALLRASATGTAEAPTPGSVAARPPAAATVERFTPVLPPWPMVGREEPLAQLVGLLEQATTGAPAFAAVIGEAGIGKSRLCAELGALALGEGARLLLGRCSQDDGAPPLWPWLQVLHWLGVELETGDEEDDGSEFRIWEAVVRHVTDAAREELLVLAIEDLHWADQPSLRVLRLLLETVAAGRLLVIGTWRAHPEPSGALGDVAEAFARRHAARIDLTGLDTAAVASVVEAVVDATPDADQTALLAARTDGNPFFLVEYARLAQDAGDLAGLMSESDPPAAVSDVLQRRLARLPEETRSLLSSAAVIGRFFELPVLSEVTGLDEDPVLDRLDPALDAGLLREDDIGHYRFGHALVRDEIYGRLSPTRRARAHARVAEALERLPGRESETARHWLAAGPACAARAWRAAWTAAAAARRVHAHSSTASLLEAALQSHAQDPDASPVERYDMLVELADAHRWRGSWTELLGAVERAIETADELGDVARLARAAAAMTTGAMWQSPSHGQVHETVVAALRRALAELPATDDELRCRAMVGLANEIYYAGSIAERTALVDEALAMARRLGKESLLLDVCQVAAVALWRPATAARRLELSEEAMALARPVGNEQAFVVAATLNAVIHAELGHIDRMWEVAEVARTAAERLHLPYSIVVLDTLLLPWHVMAGRFEKAEVMVSQLNELAQDMQMQQVRDGVDGALITLRFWQGRLDEVIPLMATIDSGPLPTTSTMLAMLLRSGLEDAAREYAADHPVDLSGEDWFSMLSWGCAAEAALALGDRTLASAAYTRLAPYEGRVVSAGSGNALGPADAFLAQAAAAVGDLDLAARHADRALELMEAWQIPLAAQVLRGQRDRFGF